MRLVRDAIPEDVASWLELADEVEDLFGPMPDIEEHIRRGIARGTAVVVVEGHAVAGAAMLSRDDEPHVIHWLTSGPASGVLGSLTCSWRRYSSVGPSVTWR